MEHLENLERLEAGMMRDIDEYVHVMDEFETALGKRQSDWASRAKTARMVAAARNKTINLIVSGAIAGAAIFLTMTTFML